MSSLSPVRRGSGRTRRRVARTPSPISGAMPATVRMRAGTKPEPHRFANPRNHASDGTRQPPASRARGQRTEPSYRRRRGVSWVPRPRPRQPSGIDASSGRSRALSGTLGAATATPCQSFTTRIVRLRHRFDVREESQLRTGIGGAPLSPALSPLFPSCPVYWRSRVGGFMVGRREKVRDARSASGSDRVQRRR